MTKANSVFPVQLPIFIVLFTPYKHSASKQSIIRDSLYFTAAFLFDPDFLQAYHKNCMEQIHHPTDFRSAV